MANASGPAFTITLSPVSGGEWEIDFRSHVRVFNSFKWLDIDSFPVLAPYYYIGGPGFGTRVRDDGNSSGINGVPVGVGSFARAVIKANGRLLIEPLH